MRRVALIQTKADLAAMLERFWELAPAAGFATGWEWDELGAVPFRQPDLEAWRQRILDEVYDLVPSDDVVINKLADQRVAIIIQDLREGKDAQD